MRRCLAVAALAALAAHAEQRPDFAWRLPLATSGDHAYYRVEIPASAYEGAVRSDLGDLRILNGDGSAVPMALLPSPAQPRERAPGVPLALFPLLVDDERRNLGDLSLRLRRDASGTSVDVTTREGASVPAKRLAGYLVDTGEGTERFAALTLPLSAAANVDVRVRVDGSDDLVSWRPLAAGAPLLALEYRGQRLTRERIDLARGSARYLRLTFSPSSVPDIANARGEFAERAVDAPRLWREAAGIADKDRPGDYTFDVGGSFPVDRVTLVLAEINTVAPAQVYAQTVPRADANAQDAWRLVGSTVFYRLRQDGGEAINPPLAVATSGERRWKIHVDPRAGGVGDAPPKLSVGWMPQSLVFAARGNGPFTLAYGSAQAKPVTLPIATLVPGFDARTTPATFGVATTGAPIAPPALAALRVPIDFKRWLLWGSLALAALVLGWMALRLSRQMGETASKPHVDPPQSEGSAERDARAS